MNDQIAIIGIGGAGSNAINRIKTQIDAYCIRIDSDDIKNKEFQLKSKSNQQILLNHNNISDNMLYESSLSDSEIFEITQAIKKHKVIILSVGLGGNTGSSIAPIVAKLASEQGKFVIAIMYKPFSFEGGRRSEVAEHAINPIKEEADYSIVIANEKLKYIGRVTFFNAFDMADAVIVDIVKNIETILQNHLTASGESGNSPLNSSKCLVCKSYVKDDMSKCPVCGFDSLEYEFINKEEADRWFETILAPARKAWQSSHCNFNDESIKSLINALNENLSQNVIIDYFG